MGYVKTITLDATYDEAVAKVKEAFKAKGFGTLTEIDVRATLHDKLGADMEPYLIIGACNPGLAKRALDADRQVGALLPCNVVVRQGDNGIIVDALDPSILATVPDSPALGPIADEAARLIGEALTDLADADRDRG
ncbi:DUF302 domain-containing protein [Acidiferrimicrobium sp. IK]|uniref:DUF302 domain-containing protein n=1 Tax=Acidiferrimicrobium sp. IK TaxID=2871700 RepID=UPI0021CB2C0F|nr:DUF302 domain-containing protein [Acidiferrimicrobium sp. IK]MCU4185144.1 DUF302 domain-containing protein [Acidiferrimicrobium sp. IK]